MSDVLRLSPNKVEHLVHNGQCVTCGNGSHTDWPEPLKLRRCTPAERKAFNARRASPYWRTLQEGEPAIGTVDERLSIILARLGKPWRLPTLTRAERAELEQCRVA